MNKILIALSLLIFVSGCGTREVIKEVEKKVPIYMVPEPPSLERPELPIHSDIGQDAGKLAKAYVVSLRLVMNWGTAMNQIVYAYEKMAERDFSLTPMTFADGSTLAAEQPNRILPEDIERNDGDFATLKIFADEEFNRIINKYEYNKNLILEEYNAPEADNKTE